MNRQVPDASEQAAVIFRFLVGNRFTDRYTAIEWLNDTSRAIDRPLLRSLILNALDADYSVASETTEADPSIGDTRSWLLSALGRISSDDDQATAEITRYLDPAIEPKASGRYWALEGLIAGRNRNVLDIARRITLKKDEMLVEMLAFAYLASSGDRQAQEHIRTRLSHPDSQGYVLRALRVVLLPSTVIAMCELVEQGKYSDESYDAIVALGRLPPASSHAPRAAQALSTAIINMRGNPWQDGMRTAAITALGNLMVESSGPLLIGELIDYNPAIVRQAARSTEKILGLSTTVSRVVEAAVNSGNSTTVDALARALRWIDRDAVAEELEKLMGSGSARQQEISRTLLSELGGAAAYEKLRVRTAAMKQYSDVLERAEVRVQELFEQSVHEAQKGFQLATRMDVTVFGVGISLILVSAALALWKGDNIAVWAGVGGTGVLGVLYALLIANPRRQVRESVDHLMKVKIVFLAYLRRLHQTDQAYTRLLLDSDKITAGQLKDYSDIVGVIMEATARQLTDIGSSAATSASGHDGVRNQGVIDPAPSAPEQLAAPEQKVDVTGRA